MEPRTAAIDTIMLAQGGRYNVEVLAASANSIPVCSIEVATSCRESVIFGTSECKLTSHPFGVVHLQDY